MKGGSDEISKTGEAMPLGLTLVTIECNCNFLSQKKEIHPPQQLSTEEHGVSNIKVIRREDIT